MICNVYQLKDTGCRYAIRNNIVYRWNHKRLVWEETELDVLRIRSLCKLVAKNVKFNH